MAARSDVHNCTMAGALQVFPVTSVFSACGTHTGVTAVDGSDEKKR